MFSYFLLSFFNFVLYDSGISGGAIVQLMGQSVYLVAENFVYKVLAVCISSYCQRRILQIENDLKFLRRLGRFLCSPKKGG
jgi:hypothetical protein